MISIIVSFLGALINLPFLIKGSMLNGVGFGFCLGMCVASILDKIVNRLRG